MNTDYIFKLFNDSIQHKSDEQIEKEIMQSAHYNAKMFLKYITNLKNFQLKLLAIAKHGTERDLTLEQNKAEYLGYNKAFDHVCRINIYDKLDVNDLDLINPFDFSYCLQVTKTYYASIEEYDRVAFLVEMMDFVEKRYENLEISE